jgi:hypothetical protein
LSRAERLGHLAALALSFPGALWALFQHPANVSADALLMSVAANSISWAVCLFLILSWLRRRAARDAVRRAAAGGATGHWNVVSSRRRLSPISSGRNWFEKGDPKSRISV